MSALELPENQWGELLAAEAMATAVAVSGRHPPAPRTVANVS